jgi:hypothetical protein
MTHAVSSLFPSELASLGEQLAARSAVAINRTTYHDTVEGGEGEGEGEGGGMQDLCGDMMFDIFSVSTVCCVLCVYTTI